MSWRITSSSSTTRTRPRVLDMPRDATQGRTAAPGGARRDPRLVASSTAPGPRSSGDRALPSGGRGAGSNPAGGTRETAGQRPCAVRYPRRTAASSNTLPTLGLSAPGWRWGPVAPPSVPTCRQARRPRGEPGASAGQSPRPDGRPRAHYPSASGARMTCRPSPSMLGDMQRVRVRDGVVAVEDEGGAGEPVVLVQTTPTADVYSPSPRPCAGQAGRGRCATTGAGTESAGRRARTPRCGRTPTDCRRLLPALGSTAPTACRAPRPATSSSLAGRPDGWTPSSWLSRRRCSGRAAPSLRRRTAGSRGAAPRGYRVGARGVRADALGPWLAGAVRDLVSRMCRADVPPRRDVPRRGRVCAARLGRQSLERFRLPRGAHRRHSERPVVPAGAGPGVEAGAPDRGRRGGRRRPLARRVVCGAGRRSGPCVPATPPPRAVPVLARCLLLLALGGMLSS